MNTLLNLCARKSSTRAGEFGKIISCSFVGISSCSHGSRDSIIGRVLGRYLGGCEAASYRHENFVSHVDTSDLYERGSSYRVSHPKTRYEMIDSDTYRPAILSLKNDNAQNFLDAVQTVPSLLLEIALSYVHGRHLTEDFYIRGNTLERL
jgi:hypothetical protein